MKRLLTIWFLVLASGCSVLSGGKDAPKTVEQELAAAILDSEQTDDAVTEKKGPFAFLRRKETPPPETEVSAIVVSADGVVEEENDGFLAGLFGSRQQDDPLDEEPDQPKADGNKNIFSFLKPNVATEPAIEGDETAEDVVDVSQPKTNIFAKIFAPKPETFDEVSDDQTVTASLAPLAATPSAKMDGPLEIVCGLSKSKMGKQVDQFPKSGRTTWRLFDSTPNSIAPRSFYITGFSDGCARSVTAALVLFGSPALHETHRYGAAQKGVSYSASDSAYEKLKSEICGVRKGKRCPENRVSKMEKLTSFVTIYPNFGGPSTRTELLLSAGRLIAQSTHQN